MGGDDLVEKRDYLATYYEIKDQIRKSYLDIYYDKNQAK